MKKLFIKILFWSVIAIALYYIYNSGFLSDILKEYFPEIVRELIKEIIRDLIEHIRI